MVDLQKREYLLFNNSAFPVAEAIKAARTNLMFTTAKEKCPVISFTSAHMGEGKSTSCANIALSFADAGFRTLVIDADMRKPTLNKFFKIKSSPGLSDILGGLVKENFIYPTKHKNLHVLPSGTIPPNPSELLTSERMSLLLSELRETLDYIFIDTPPVLIVTDAVALSNKVTGTVFAVRQNFSHSNMVKEAMSAFDNVNGKILGVIFTDYDIETLSQNKSYKYGKYGNKYSKYERYGGYDKKPVKPVSPVELDEN
ncbi:MAG: CpsD/CapB family tyrosine-protein kinase [Clostridia bacterium]